MLTSLTYPEVWKGGHTCLYYAFCTLSPPLKNTVGPVMELQTFVVDSLYVVTYRSIAYFTLSSRLSRCTAMSIRVTTSPLSALAVTSIRSIHR
jgi:hypothetical protein